MDTKNLLKLLIILQTIYTFRCCDIAQNSDEPLILTSYLYSVDTNITDIRCLSTVGPIKGVTNYETYSGYFEVDSGYKSNIFFWFIPLQNQVKSANSPLMLWLGGGNGISGMISVLGEIGPFQVSTDGTSVTKRVNNWANLANILVIDAPVGTGYSFTGNDKGYATNSTSTANQLFNALMQFFKVFPEFLSRDLYLAAESYSARYAATLAYRIYYENPYLECPLNLRGIITLSPEFDYSYCLNISSQLFDLGLLNEADYLSYSKSENTIENLLQANSYGLAMSAFSSLVLGQLWPTLTTYQTLTGLQSYKNVENPYDNYSYPQVAAFLNRTEIRKAFNVGGTKFANGLSVVQHDYDDVMVPYTPWVVDMLNREFRWLMAIGQFGLLINPADFDQYVSDLNWKSTDEYYFSRRVLLKINNTNRVMAYATQVSNLMVATVLGAGQVVAADQPQAMIQLLQLFLSGEHLS